VRIYWFWPYVHADQLVLPAAVPRPGDHLVLHTMRDRVAASDVAGMPIELAATLAEPTDTRERSLKWMTSRAATYVQRIAERRRALRNGTFDVCHVVFSNYFVDGIDFRRIARRTALVFEVHDVVPHESRLPERVERTFLSFLYRAPGSIVVRHEVVRDGLVQQFGIDANRIKVVPWHVPVVSRVERSAPGADPTFLFFGTLRRNKGVPQLLAAIEQVADLASASFVFAGRGFPDVEEQIREAERKDHRIRFEQGYVTASRKHELYSAADVVVLPYTEFPSNSAVMSDAYAYSLPIIASDVGGLGASVRADETGWVVRPSDADALAAAIRNTIDDAPAWRRASENAARVAEQRSPQRIGEMLRALYDDVLGRPGAQ
jgi:glycosyltransferase involved in cell wall biosynthesis